MEENNVNVTEVMDDVERVEGDVVNAIDTARDVAQKVIVGVSEDVGEGISNIAKGVGVLAITGVATVLAAAGYGVYKGTKWVSGKISSGKKQKNDEKAAETDQANQEETAQQEQVTDDGKKAKK